MTELISLNTANHIILAVLIAAPLIGLLWGVLAKQVKRGLAYGCVLGVGNYVMWTVYNAITSSLGLDTVKNLLVNLTLFVFVGIAAGIAIARFDRRSTEDKGAEKADLGDYYKCQ
jgi:drug/metabolite transporter (DMT)-like permease